MTRWRYYKATSNALSNLSKDAALYYVCQMEANIKPTNRFLHEASNLSICCLNIWGGPSLGLSFGTDHSIKNPPVGYMDYIRCITWSGFIKALRAFTIIPACSPATPSQPSLMSLPRHTRMGPAKSAKPIFVHQNNNLRTCCLNVERFGNTRFGPLIPLVYEIVTKRNQRSLQNVNQK